MKIFAFGSSILSSYWNGAATYYRGCYKYLHRLGHQITFAEPDAYGRQQHRDSDSFDYVTSRVYQPGSELDAMLELAAQADVVVKHSGIGVDDALLEHRINELRDRCIITFWDVDAPATIARMHSDARDPFRVSMPQYDAVLTYGGGPFCEREYLGLGARAYFTMYNGLDPETHFPVERDDALQCDVAFLGNRLPDREARVDELFLRAAQLAPEMSFILGGEGWAGKRMPPNVRWIGHVPTSDHNRVNCSASMVLNINRASMATSGFSPPTRIFEVAGAGTCLLCDEWPGIDDCFEPNTEILVVRDAEDVIRALRTHDVGQREKIGRAFRARALRDHTYAQRAIQAERAFTECMASRPLQKSSPR